MNDEHYGWICPRCGMVFAPTQPLCPFCKHKKDREIKSDRPVKEDEGGYDDTYPPFPFPSKDMDE